MLTHKHDGLCLYRKAENHIREREVAQQRPARASPNRRVACICLCSAFLAQFVVDSQDQRLLRLCIDVASAPEAAPTVQTQKRPQRGLASSQPLREDLSSV